MIVGTFELLLPVLRTLPVDYTMFVVSLLQFRLLVWGEVRHQKDVASFSSFLFVHPLSSAFRSAHRHTTAHALMVGGTAIWPVLRALVRAKTEAADGSANHLELVGKQRGRNV